MSKCYLPRILDFQIQYVLVYTRVLIFRIDRKTKKIGLFHLPKNRIVFLNQAVGNPAQVQVDPITINH